METAAANAEARAPIFPGCSRSIIIAAAVHSAACSDGKLFSSSPSGRRSGTALFNASAISLIARKHPPALRRPGLVLDRRESKIAEPISAARPPSAKWSQAARLFLLRILSQRKLPFARKRTAGEFVRNVRFGSKADATRSRKFGSLRPRQEEREQLRPAFAVDDPVDEIGPEPSLKGDHRFLRIGDVIAETL